MPARARRAFTLIELLIVVSIIAILALIGLYNFRLATNRAYKVHDASNLHTLIIALQTYHVDFGKFPPADREAGPAPSHTAAFTAVGNGPAAGGSWDGVPWLLYERGYVSDWKVFFNPKYLRLYGGRETIRGGHPRYHNFRYAYNSAAISSGGASGGIGNINSGDVWILRNLFLPAEMGFYAASYPEYPADYGFPWGEGEFAGKLEHAVFGDGGVRTVFGGRNDGPGTNF